MGGGLLHIAQRHPGIERRGDERMAQRVGADFLADRGAARNPADDPSRAMAVQPPSVRRQEDRPAAAFAGSQVERPASRDQLIHAIHVIAAGDALLAPKLVRRLIEDFCHRPPP